MPSVIPVQLGERTYPVRVGHGLLHSLAGGCRGRFGARDWLLVSDAHVAPLYAATVSKALEQDGRRVIQAVVPAGEQSKSLACLGRLYEQTAAAGLDRSALVLALGGGVVGDLAGFLAATYLRGVGLVQAPTSLLAMVDSAVGGKTAVNLEAGKNLVGAFYQPAEVFADLATLDTLPEREYVSGLAEVVKYGAIADNTFFEWLEQHAGDLLARTPEPLETAVTRCCEIKAQVVAGDERESGRRAILNFGHTLGHAFERVGGYGRWLHGEAVSMGMVYAAALSRRQGLLPDAAGRLVALLARLGLPVDAPALEWDALRATMAHDKKARDGVPAWVLLEGLGCAETGFTVHEEVLAQTFREWSGDKGGLS